MARREVGFRGGLVILIAFLALLPAVGADEAKKPSGSLVAFVVPELVDGIAAAQQAEIEAAIAAYERRKGTSAPPAGKQDGPFLYPFFPQAGILGRDLFLSNFTDQDPNSGLIRDWDCTDYTYDGHHGHDSLIRSFREQAVGVPVFAVLGGVVVDTHDGEPDMNLEGDPQKRGNFVVIDHGSGYQGVYFHFRQGSVVVSPGQEVAAGTQLGLTGSSGFSSWPHLHFETRTANEWVEPSAGPCRSGDSLWVAQPPVIRDFYIADFFLTRGEISIPDVAALANDLAPRAGSFVKGFQTVGLRADLRNLPAMATYLFRVLTPRGQVVFGSGGSFQNPTVERLAFAAFSFDIDLSAPGTWRFLAEIDGVPVLNAPFQVVATERQLKNRPPKKVTARLTPSRPVEGQVLTCQAVQASLVFEDPDYDLVSYRYEWKVNGRIVRSVTSAALTDLLPAGAARAKDRVSCRVVPSDLKAQGPAAAARIVEER